MALYNGDKQIHELYNGDVYIEELYNGDTKIFDAGWDTTLSGTAPLTATDARAKATSWEIDGQSSQNGTPTPTNPVDVQDCGDYGGKRNQLVVNGNFESTSGWGATCGTISATNNVCVFVAEEGIAGNARIQQANINIISSHKVYLSFSLKTPINERCTVYSDAWEEFCEVETLANVKKNVSIIKELNQNANILRIYFNSNESLQGGDTVEIENVQFIDLTAMFPTDTPTDVSTAKARIAEVMGGQQEYYPYDAGTDYYKIPEVVTSGACVDLGSLDWIYRSDNNVFSTVTRVSDIADTDAEIFTNKYETNIVSPANLQDKQITSKAHYNFKDFCIKDSAYGTDATAFKQAMSGVYLYYQRATDESWYIQNKTIYLPAPLQKIGTYKDTIESDGTLTRGVGVKVLDGTETWYYDQTWSRFFTVLSGLPSQTETARIVRGFSTHYEWIYDGRSISRVTAGQGYFGYIGGGDSGVYLHDSHTSVADFTTWLASNNIIVYYPLAEATTSTVQVPVISTQKGTNYIDVETEISPSNVELTYRKRTQ